MIELLGIDVFHRGSREFDAVLASAAPYALRSPHRPDLIVRPRADIEVAAACAYAAAHGQRPYVLTWQSMTLAEPGGMLLDLSQLRRVSVDPSDGIALIEPAATAADLAGLLATHAPVGPTVIFASRVLCAGFLPGSPAWIVADESVRGLDLVTWDGHRRHVDRRTHPELFAAITDQTKPYPGIFTRVHLEIGPLPAAILVSVHRYPASALRPLLRWLEHMRPTFPVGLELSVLTGPAQDADDSSSVRLVGAVGASSMAAAVEALGLLERSPLLADAIIDAPATPTTLDVVVDQHPFRSHLECRGKVRVEWLPEGASAIETWASSHTSDPLSLIWWRDPRNAADGARALAMSVEHAR
ncbi:FAD-binding protein [Microbacterium maritypicum]|uniref:FAD-binding protein n=1 Tax=Microbacterium maritypicum TaxID=33918 RepID=UPI003817F8D6